MKVRHSSSKRVRFVRSIIHELLITRKVLLYLPTKVIILLALCNCKLQQNCRMGMETSGVFNFGRSIVEVHLILRRRQEETGKIITSYLGSIAVGIKKRRCI